MAISLRCIRKPATAAILLLSVLALNAHAQAICEGQGSCLDAILNAAHAGREAEELALMHEMRQKARGNAPTPTAPSPPPKHPLPLRLPEMLGVGDIDTALVLLVGNADKALAGLPEYHRALALAYLKTNRVDDARHLLEDALERDPVYAPYWTDLAIVYARQGRHERAVSSLVVADTWAGDPAALRDDYRQAARDTPEPGMGVDFEAALQVIAANEAAQARAEGALAPVQWRAAGAAPAHTAAVIDFGSCARPEYPKPALRYLETGTTTLHFLVGADGSIQRVRKMRSSGHPDLDNAAAFSLAACRFRPATVDGKPVATWQPVQYVWTLE